MQVPKKILSGWKWMTCLEKQKTLKRELYQNPQANRKVLLQKRKQKIWVIITIW